MTSSLIAIYNNGKYSIEVLTNSGNTTFTNCNVKYQKGKSLALPEAFSLSNEGTLERVVRGSQEEKEGSLERVVRGSEEEKEGDKVIHKYDCQSSVNTVVYTWGVDFSLNQSDAFGLFDKKAFENINSSEFMVITDQIVR